MGPDNLCIVFGVNLFRRADGGGSLEEELAFSSVAARLASFLVEHAGKGGSARSDRLVRSYLIGPALHLMAQTRSSA